MGGDFGSSWGGTTREECGRLCSIIVEHCGGLVLTATRPYSAIPFCLMLEERLSSVVAPWFQVDVVQEHLKILPANLYTTGMS